MTTEENQCIVPGMKALRDLEHALNLGTCRCGAQVLVGWIGDVENNYRVAVCRTGDHVTVGTTGLSAKIYVYVENPQDVIVHTAGHADTCARRQMDRQPDPECDCGVGTDE